MTEVHVECGPLDDGVPMVFKDFGRRVRMKFDHRCITESLALCILFLYLPRLVGRMEIVRHATA